MDRAEAYPLGLRFPNPAFTRGELGQMAKQQKVAVIGLDCAAPEMVFDQWRDELPCLRSLCEQGVWGKLESVTPPITDCIVWV